MDAQEINNILTSHWATRGTFIGTFPCDMLPESINQKVFGLVVNTEDHTQPGGHWLAIYTSSPVGAIEYFDSYGMKPSNDKIVDFLENTCNKFIQYSIKRVQGLFSTSCGQHCVYFLTHRSTENSFQDILNSYSDTNFKRNDRMVEEFCKQNFGYSISKSDSEAFLSQQISRELVKRL